CAIYYGNSWFAYW
nr:immunoglobulin heavy chain junction region [Mus musculus]